MACTGLQVYSAHKLKWSIYRWLHSFCNALFNSPLNTSTVSVFWSVTPSQKKKKRKHPINRKTPYLFDSQSLPASGGQDTPLPPHRFYLTVVEKTGGRGERRRSQVILWIISLMPGENERDRKREGWMCSPKRERCGKIEWCVHFLFALLGGSRHWIFKDLTFRHWKVCENSAHPGGCESDVKAQL